MGFIKDLFLERVMYVHAPVSGQVKTLESLNDGVFSEKLLGDGCVIVPEEGVLAAPFDGEIIMVVDTRHAIGITSCDGIELLIHIGLDTVTMNGDGFTMLVKQGEQVIKGQKLLTFSREQIHKAGFVDDVILIVSNAKEYREVTVIKSGEVKGKEVLIAVRK